MSQPEKQLNRSWTTNADAWTRAVRDNKIQSRVDGTNQAIMEAILQCQPKRVLDVGCGEGWLARSLSEQGIEAVGVDGSAPLIEAAMEKGGEFHVLSYDDIIADPERLGDAYDVIVCNFALLGEDLQPLLKALRSRLQKNGYLLIQTVHPFTATGEQPYQDSWRVENFDSFGGEFKEAMPWYFRTVGSWISLMHDSGYHLERCYEPVLKSSEMPLSLLLVCQINALQ